MPGPAGPARPRTGAIWRLLAAAAAVGSAGVAAAQAPPGDRGGWRPFVPPLGATSGLPNVVAPAPVPAAPPSAGLSAPQAAVPVPSDPPVVVYPGVPVPASPLDVPPVGEGSLPTGPTTSFPPTGVELDPFAPAPAPAVASAASDAYPPVFGGPRKPLPGSLANEVDRYFAAKSLFRYCTWRDATVSVFPSTLLWEPPLAIFREPRMAAQYTTLNNYRGENTLETSLGTTFGIVRVEPIGSDLKVQLDLFGVVQTRLSPDDVMAQSYRFGFPVTFARGPWTGKIGYEHTSDHLGDELIFATGRKFTRYAKNELVIGLSRYFYDSLRVYGQWSYAGDQDLPAAFDRNRYDAGFEYYDRRPTGFAGTPFLAFNSTWRGEQKHVPITTTQFGWLWRNPEQRLASFRLFGSYYSGGSPYGQFFQDGREHWWSIGIAGDY